jgi:dTDP-4-amino-4,6-dideoxygalactose transaminase
MTPTIARIPFLDLGAMHEEVREDLEAAWAEVVEARAFIGGPFVERFEAAWAAYCGAEHCVGVGNGTDAITVALRAMGIGPGDEVVVPANTFVATATAVSAAGATPVFADVDPDTLLLGPAQLEAVIGPRVAAAIVVHLYGQMADMDALAAVAAQAGVALLEDAAQAHGALWRGLPPGAFGQAATFSFYPGKNLGAYGDGGAIVTRHADVAERARLLANHGRSPQDRFVHLVPGANSRLDGIQAAVLLSKLAHLDRWNEARRHAHGTYDALLADLPLGRVRIAPEAVAVHHVEPVLVDRRDEVAAALARLGVDSNIHYRVPCHVQAAYADLRTPPLPVVEDAARRELSLPMYPHLSDAMVERVCDGLRAALTETGAARA